jgi:RNA polymerase primary sigma factor
MNETALDYSINGLRQIAEIETDAEPVEKNYETEQHRSQSFDASLHQYMREVNSVSLLPHQETIDLFRAIDEKLRAIQGLDRGSLSPSEREATARSLQREIAEIKERLVISNLRLVVYLANRYQGRGVSIHDLVQEGNIGLIRAIDKFDYRLGYRFSTYATWWIRQGMLRAIHQHGRLIRIPTHMLEKFQRYVQKTDPPKKGPSLNEGGDGEPSKHKAEDDLDMINLLEIMRDPLSLDAPMTDDGLDLQEVTRDELQLPPDDRVIERDLRKKLRSTLTTLTLREEIILRMRYGIDLPESHTLEEVGQLFSLTKERIRQIESKALKRLHQAHAYA